MASRISFRCFPTTSWSLVRAAIGGDDAEARRALAALCDAYWYPLYAYIRRSGKGPHDAEDLIQGFFQRLLESDMLAAADPEKGKLRTFLLTCTRNYMADQRDRQMAQKRGGGLQVHMDPALAEERYAAEPVDDLSPDRLFQRGWAMSVLEHALGLLEEEFSEEGKGKLFEALRPFLGLGPEPEKRYDEIADTLAIPVGTLKSHVHRLRARWCELLFEEVAKTLDDPTAENIKAELVELLGCV